MVKDDVRITGKDAMTKTLSGMNAPGFQGAKLSKMNMGGMGRRMMRMVAQKGNLMPPEDLSDQPPQFIFRKNSQKLRSSPWNLIVK